MRKQWMRLILTVYALLSPALTFGQNGVRFDGLTLSPSGKPVSASVAVCNSPGLATTAAQVVGNTAILTFGSSPITAGFAPNMSIAVSGFSGGDTYFNVGTLQPFASTVTITAVSATTITFPLTHANASASTNGSVFQLGNIAQACAPLASIFSDANVSVPITQPGFVSSNIGNVGFYVNPGQYAIQYYGTGITAYLQPLTLTMAFLSANNAFTGNTTTKNLNFFRYVDALNASGWSGANPAAWIQSAINDCGSTPCTVTVNANVGAGTPATLPDNVTLWDYRNLGRLSISLNPVTVPANGCGPAVIIGPPGWAAGNPIANNCVGYYTAIQTTNAATSSAWGFNDVVKAGAGVVGGNLWGGEWDVAPTSLTSGAFGSVPIAAGPGQPTSSFPAFRCQTAQNTNPVGAWKNCLEVTGISDSVFTFDAKDTGLQITQVVTLSGSPQTVTTNGNCTVFPFSQLYVGGVLSVDSGGSQEDVIITNTGCSGTTTVTGIFTKNHVNPTNFTEYAAKRIWDAGSNGSVTSNIPYVWGSIQAWNTSNTPQVLSFAVLDSAGALRTVEFYGATNGHAYRSLGTPGFTWQSQAAATILNLTDAGVLSDANAVPYTKTIGSGTSTTNGTAIATLNSQAQPAITITGALVTDTATCSLNAAMPATWQTGIQMLPPVVTANTVTVWLSNPTATANITPAATAVRCTVTR